jgi:MFS family permease
MCFGIQERPKQLTSARDEKQKPSIAFLKTIYFNRQVIFAALYTSLMNMSVAVLGAMMGSLYLMQRLAIAKPQAAMINSMLFLGAIVGGPLMGWLSDRLEQRILPMKVAAVLALGVILMIMYFPLSVLGMEIAFFALGLITSAQVISYALVAEMNSPKVTAMAISVISILTQGGYVIYQNLFSYVLTHFGSEAAWKNGEELYSLASYQTAAIIFPLGLALAYFLVRTLKDSNQSQRI